MLFICGEPDRDVLCVRPIIFAATMPPFIGCGGDIMPSGTGGGGGKASRPEKIANQQKFYCRSIERVSRVITKTKGNFMDLLV